MKKNQLKSERYFTPQCEVIVLANEQALLAGSPRVRPGGGGSGNVTINPLDPDDGGDDDDIEAP
ncbi:hypothetical protein [Hoylesella enoeca]|uniref:Uncharacterized protein n=1 Tax=Hoylesella enoeca TaxID=76123 RepID=A0A0S2KPJ5_9BACT|nr:hypothetical protein [Hoylesella enoeca]ALO50019.1 hypothetical protein AS203_12170 [Hoylesella enoeca]